jgi:hypothetical protein
VSHRGRAERLLATFAGSDLDALRDLCREDVVVFGTDRGERWDGLGVLLPALDGMRALGLRACWTEPVIMRPGWIAGVATYSGAAMAPTDVRVTFAFDADGRLAHAHFSLAAA